MIFRIQRTILRRAPRARAFAIGLLAMLTSVALDAAQAHETHAKEETPSSPDVAEPDRPAARSVLATPGQLEREALTLEILATPQLARATNALEQIFLGDPRGKTPSGRETARRAAASTAAAAVHAVVNEDPTRPVVFWGVNAPHEWHGLKVPRSGYGIENPDNVYRSIQVDGASRYVIRGRFPKPGPAELHFVVMDMRPRAGKIAAEAGEVLATLRSDAMAIARNGTFTIEIDADPAKGRRNHLRIPPKGRFPVYIRDLFTDWARQKPVALEVERVAGPPATPAEDVEALAERAAQRLLQMGSFWVAYNDQHLYSKPANELPPPHMRPGGRGLGVSAHFALADDEALVVTLDRLGAASLGFQLADPWGVAYEYVDRTGSLNQDQAVPDPDGRYTYVIAASDPGVHNGLDPDGQTAGIMVLRWQVLAGEPPPGKGIEAVKIVKLADLRTALPAGTRLVTREERTAQRAERARQYQRRLEP